MMMFCLIPFRDVMVVNIGGIVIRPSEILFLIFLFLFLFREIPNKLNFKISISRRITYSMTIFYFYYFIRCLLSMNGEGVDTNRIIKEIFSMSLYFGIFIFLYAYLSKTNNNYKFKLLKYLNVSILITSILYIFPYITGIGEVKVQFMYLMGKEIKRYIGFTNEAAFYVSVIIVPYCIMLFRKFDKFKQNKRKILWILFITVCILLTFSGSGYASMLAIYSLFVYIAIKDEYRNKLSPKFIIKILFITIIGISLVKVISSEDSIVRSLGVDKIINSEYDYSSNARSGTREVAFDMFTKNKLLGNNVATYESYYNSYSCNLKVKEEGTNDAKSLYFLYLGEQGIIGLIFLLQLFASIVYEIYIRYKLSENMNVKSIFLGGLVGIGILLVHFYAIGHMWMYYIWMYLALIISINPISIMEVENENSSSLY